MFILQREEYVSMQLAIEDRPLCLPAAEPTIIKDRSQIVFAGQWLNYGSQSHDPIHSVIYLTLLRTSITHVSLSPSLLATLITPPLISKGR